MTRHPWKGAVERRAALSVLTSSRRASYENCGALERSRAHLR